MRTKEATFTSVDGSIEHELKNTDRLVGEMPNLVGAKTGFTPRAGYCLTLTSTDPTRKRNIISVVLDDYHRFDDVQTMSAWAFDNYTWQ
jgi:D-alanyl-D-alanine carboxypeptidase